MLLASGQKTPPLFICLVMIINAKMGFNDKEKECIAYVNEFEQDYWQTS